MLKYYCKNLFSRAVCYMNIDLIKLQITELYEKNVEVHIDVFSTRPKININNAVAKITGVIKICFELRLLRVVLKRDILFNTPIYLLEK